MFHVDADTVWQDVFDSVSGVEQACIRSEVDGDVLDSVLEERVMTDDETEEWVASIFGCLTPDNARSLFLNTMVGGLREEMDVEAVSDEEMSCLRDLVADLDVAALVAADAAGEADLEFADLSAILIGCLPDVFLELMVAGLGVDKDELSEDELSCIREWMSETDWAALMTAEDDAEVLDAFGGLFDLVNCVPDLFELPDAPAGGPDDYGDFIEEATAVTVGEPVHGEVDDPGDVGVFVFEAVGGEPYRLEVALGSLEDSVVFLYDADETELAFNDDDAGTLASLITWVAPESGSYYVVVGSYGDGVGSYTLSVGPGIPDDHVDSHEGATPVDVDGSVEGALDHFGDVDVFVFEAVEGERYQVDVTLGSLEDSVLSLDDPDGWELAFNDDARRGIPGIAHFLGGARVGQLFRRGR